MKSLINGGLQYVRIQQLHGLAHSPPVSASAAARSCRPLRLRHNDIQNLYAYIHPFKTDTQTDTGHPRRRTCYKYIAYFLI